MSLLRKYVALFLALSLVLLGQGAAASKGARDAAGRLVICSGMGTQVIYVDQEGEPTRPPHICPDCIAHLLDTGIQAADAPYRQQWRREAPATSHPSVTLMPVLRSHRARAPPAL